MGGIAGELGREEIRFDHLDFGAGAADPMQLQQEAMKVAHVLQHVAAQGVVERIVLERLRHGVEIVDDVHARPGDGFDVDEATVYCPHFLGILS